MKASWAAASCARRAVCSRVAAQRLQRPREEEEEELEELEGGGGGDMTAQASAAHDSGAPCISNDRYCGGCPVWRCSSIGCSVCCCCCCCCCCCRCRCRCCCCCCSFARAAARSWSSSEAKKATSLSSTGARNSLPPTDSYGCVPIPSTSSTPLPSPLPSRPASRPAPSFTSLPWRLAPVLSPSMGLLAGGSRQARPPALGSPASNSPRVSSLTDGRLVGWWREGADGIGIVATINEAQAWVSTQQALGSPTCDPTRLIPSRLDSPESTRLITRSLTHSLTHSLDSTTTCLLTNQPTN